MTFPALAAVGTNRVIDFERLEAPLACICFAQATQAGAEPLEAALRERYPDASSLLIAHVVDLRGVPGLFRGMARRILDSEYEKAAQSLPAGHAPYDYTIILPDWDGVFVDTTGLSDVSKRLGVALFAPDGTLIGTHQGDEPAAAVLAMLPL